jgi:hypothetical protein
MIVDLRVKQVCTVESLDFVRDRHDIAATYICSRSQEKRLEHRLLDIT